MHIHKTGALIRAAVTLGAACGGDRRKPESRPGSVCARRWGLPFRWSTTCSTTRRSTGTLGKTAGKDSRQGKPTYVSTLGLARARALADELRAEALAALEGLGARAARLAQLADFIVLRKF